MCGIAGFADLSGKSDGDRLRSMTDTLIHRGPDGSGYEVYRAGETSIGLGHRRLAIIDLTEAGKQPMRYAHLHITFNGEIYNYREIRVELEQKGHSFKSHSDTETILHAYAEWGSRCVDKFIGMFAFVIYDEEKNLLFCARDRAGVKPFYYYRRDGLFLFASELKAFHAHPGFQKELNYDAVAAFMQYGNVPGEHAIFRHTHKLPPGHFLTHSLSEGRTKTERYWNVYDAYNRPKLTLSFAEAKTQTAEILQSAFAYRMISDVPVGVFLSGGFDSACVAALLQKDRTEKLKTYTVGVPDIGLNEAPYAKDVAARLGTEHHEYYCTEKEALELIPLLPHFYDEPFADSSAVPTMLVSRMARRDVTVALSADAGDEVFAGYNRYDYLMKFGPLLQGIPKPLRHLAAAVMQRIPAERIPYLSGRYNFANRYEKLKHLLLDPSPEKMMQSLSRQWNGETHKSLFSRDFSELRDLYGNTELTPQFYTPLSYMMAIDYVTYLPDDILQKVDRAAMSVSLEGREPFLDHRVIEWAARLPDDFKYRNGIKKYILREIVYDYLPKEMMNRPKMGFAVPVEKWLMHDLRDVVETYLNQKAVREEGVLNPAATENLKKQFYGGRSEYGVKLWHLLMFRMWSEKWMG
jgi:asparagine synthase (glutamine-hydrolysing)